LASGIVATVLNLVLPPEVVDSADEDEDVSQENSTEGRLIRQEKDTSSPISTQTEEVK
jgi:hypothetical protein